MRWVVRYSLTITWSSASVSPVGVTMFQTEVSARRLAELVAKAREDPGVVRHRHTPVHRLEGEPATCCRAGHPYPTGYLESARACRGWLPCTCAGVQGGHHIRICPEPDCPDPRWIGPGPDPDICTAEVVAWPTATAAEAAAAAAR